MATLGVSACTGDTGDKGPNGPTGATGPAGPPGTAGIPVTSAKAITAAIAGVMVPEDGKPVVDVRLVDETGVPVSGLAAGSISFVLARLEPGVNGQSSTWHAITRWTEASADSSANQATTESGATGQWTESPIKNGQYTYKFAQSLNGVSGIPYDPSLVHRVGLEIRTSSGQTTQDIPANNPVFTWVPATSTSVAQSGREIVDNATCNACHDRLAVHGGARVDLPYCVMCHESYSSDAQSGNTIDFKVMIHKIHAGATLPTVQAGGTYGIFGYDDTFYDFSDVVFPQDTRNCQTCHREGDANTPQASNYRLVINRAACGSCHDNVNFTTGANHGDGVAATDDTCVSCHGPTSSLDGGRLRPEVAHLVPEDEAAKQFKFEVVRVQAIKADGSPGATTCPSTTTGCKVLPGEFAQVTIRVSNPTTGALYKITDPPFTDVIPCTPEPPETTCTPTPARLRVRVAYTTQNFTNPASGNTPAQPIAIDFLSSSAAPAGAPAAAGGFPVLNADGTYTKAAAYPIPAGLVGGTGEAFLEGRAIVDVSTNPTMHDYVEARVTSSAGLLYPITDSTGISRRPIVDVAKCDDCHNRLSAHGANRTDNVELCAACHNPENAAGTSLATGEPYDLKLFIHGIHAGTYNFGGLSYVGVRYPGKLNNCEGCHRPGTYYPVDPAKVFATSVVGGADAGTPVDDVAYTPSVAACSACHTAAIARAHMEQNGGSFSATKNANGTSNEAALEVCGTCHGAGRSADVKVVHGVSAFKYN